MIMLVTLRRTACLAPLVRRLPLVQQHLSSSFSREKPPPQDNIAVGLGHRVIEEKPKVYTEVEVSTKEWTHVENILPKEVMPEPPQHDSYPTPSGWFPQTASCADLPYFVRRTRFHNFPVYLEILSGGSRKMTVVRKVEGDIWALEDELRKYLQEKTGGTIITQVDEVCTKLRIRGIHLENVAEFLKEKGL